MAVTIKSQREIELMRESCKILADVFSQMEKAVHPGVSTLDINNLLMSLLQPDVSSNEYAYFKLLSSGVISLLGEVSSITLF